MGKGEQNKLYAVEIETTRGRRERVWPEGGSELVDVETAEGRFGRRIEDIMRGQPVEGRAASDIAAVHLVAVTVEILEGKAPEGERKQTSKQTSRDVETRRRAWGWKSEPQKRAA